MTVTASISPTQSDVQKVLRRFLIDVTALPEACVFAAQPNRVAEPKATNFIEMTVRGWRRLRTNIDTAVDTKFLGTASELNLVVSELYNETTITIGSVIGGIGVPPGTKITAQTDGDPGLTGTYTVDSDLDIPNQQVFGAGGKIVEIGSVVTVQLDYHSADYSSSSIAQTVAALMRDEYAVQFFADIDPRISPISADDPVMRPFVNAETAYEWRLVSEVELQVNQTVRVPLEFADSVELFLVSVDATFPPPTLDFSQASNSMFLPVGL